MKSEFRIRLAYFSSSPQSIPVLDALLRDPEFDVVGVVTKPDMDVRGKLIENGIKTVAKKNSLTVFTPESLKDPNFQKNLTTLKPDLIITAHYAFLIPKEILEIPRYGGLNLHFSLLPAYPGPSPLEWAILNGETLTGISIIKMSPKFDTGQIIYQETQEIGKDDTAGELYDKFFIRSAEIFPQIIKGYVNGELAPQEQSGEKVKDMGVKHVDVYARKGTREDSHIDWNKTDEALHNQIRAFTPRPGALTTLTELTSFSLSQPISPIPLITPLTPKDKSVKILKTHLEDGKLVIDSLQVEGKKPINWHDFLHGYL